MKVQLLLSLSLAVGVVEGCDHHKPTVEFLALDVSKSITQAGSDAMWEVAKSSAQGLQRGDSLVVLPITGDAGNDVSGRSLLIAAPDIRHREALDQDMEELHSKGIEDIESLRKLFEADPGADTDLLGTVQVISEKLQLLPKGTQAKIEFLTDGIQDDRRFNFKTDSRLESPEKARALARDVAKQSTSNLQGVPVYLGYLESRDVAPLSRRRRQAITAFWLTFLSQQGARVTVATDGPGSAQSFLERSMED